MHINVTIIIITINNNNNNNNTKTTTTTNKNIEKKCKALLTFYDYRGRSCCVCVLVCLWGVLGHPGTSVSSSTVICCSIKPPVLPPLFTRLFCLLSAILGWLKNLCIVWICWHLSVHSRLAILPRPVCPGSTCLVCLPHSQEHSQPSL